MKQTCIRPSNLLARIARVTLLVLSLGYNLKAQVIQDKTPSEQVATDGIASQVKTFGGGEDYDVSAGGDLSVSIPLMNISGRRLQLPVGMSYSPGIKADQKASDVGLGWEIGFGAIYRDIGDFEPDYTNEFRYESDGQNALGVSTQINSLNQANLNHLTHGESMVLDGMAPGQFLSDNYVVSIPGLGGNSFWNNGGTTANGDPTPNRFSWSGFSNWRIAYQTQTFSFDQELSRVNELTLGTNPNYDPQNGSHAAAIGILNSAGPTAGAAYTAVSTGTGMSQVTATTLANNILPNLKVNYEDYASFTITDEAGTKYVFGRPLRAQKYIFPENPYWSTSLASQGTEGGFGGNPIYSTDASKGEFWKTEYIYGWLLTEILSQDYVDADGDGKPSDGDYGDWIKLEYADENETIEVPDLPGGGSYNLPKYREYLNYSQTDIASSLWREKGYLTQITTPTQIMTTSLSERYEVDHDYYSKPINQPYQNKPDFEIHYTIGLRRYDSFSLTDRISGKRISKNVLEYTAQGSAEQLAKSSYLIRSNGDTEPAFNANTAPYQNGVRGKTTLLGVRNMGTNDADPQEYSFSYGYNPDYTDIHRAKMWTELFYPQKRESRASLFNLNPNYQVLTPPHPTGMSENEFFAYASWPYTQMYPAMGTLANPALSHQGIPITKRMDESGNYFDNNAPNQGRHAWSLSRLTYPTGGSIEIEYERDRFQYALDRSGWTLKDNELTNVQTAYNNYTASQRSLQDQIDALPLQICDEIQYKLLTTDNSFGNTGPKRIAAPFSFPLNEFSGGLRVKSVSLSDGLNSTYPTTYEYGVGANGLGSLVEPSAAYWGAFMQSFNKHLRIQRSREVDENYCLPGITSISGLARFENNFDFFVSPFSSLVRIDIASPAQVLYPKIRITEADGAFTLKSFRTTPINTPKTECRPLKHLGNLRRDVFVISSNALYGLGDHIRTEYFRSGETAAYATETKEFLYQIEDARQISYRSWSTIGSSPDYPGNYWVPYYAYLLPDNANIFNTGWIFANPGDQAGLALDIISYLSIATTLGSANHGACTGPLNNLNTVPAANVFSPQPSSSFTRHFTLAQLLMRTTSEYEGVESEVAYVYEQDYYQVRQEQRTGSKPVNGQAQVLVTNHRYGFDIYPNGSAEWNALEAKNMLTQALESASHSLDANLCCTGTASNILAAKASVLEQENQFGRDGLYLSHSFAFNTRNVNPQTGYLQSYQGFSQPGFAGSTSPMNGSEWVEIDAVPTKRDRYGNVICHDSPYLTGKTVYGYNGSVVKAVFANTGGYDASYIGFEDYHEYTDANGNLFNWYGDGWGDPTSYNNALSQRSTESKSGNWSFRLIGPGDISPAKQLDLTPRYHFPSNAPTGTGQVSYDFSYWVKSNSGSVPIQTEIVFDFGANCADVTASGSYPVSAVGSWIRLSGQVMLPTNCGDPAIYVRRTGAPGANGFIDDLVVYPTGAEFEYQALDQHRNPTSRTGQTFNYVRASYDQWGRLTQVFDANDELVKSYQYQLTGDVQNANSYIETAAYSNPIHVAVSRVYLDGLGRKKQIINWEPSQQRGIIYSTFEYDAKGRVSKTYNPLPLPNLSSGLPAKYLDNYPTRAVQFYGSNHAFSETIFDQTPDNRILRQFHPRLNWQSGDGFTFEYSASQQAVAGFEPGELLRLDTYGEDGSLFTTWMDKFGQKIQTLSPADDGITRLPLGGVNKGGAQLIDLVTTYQYDRAGRLIKITNSEGQTSSFAYNSIGNQIKAETPDRGLTEYRYDAYGRIRFVMEPEDRAYNSPVSSAFICNPALGTCRRFSYFSYDSFGRVVEEGMIYQDPASFNDLAAANDLNYPGPGDIFKAHIKNTYSGPVSNNQGRLVSQVVTHDFVFNPAANQFVGQTPDIYNYQYDANGNLKEQYFQISGLSGTHQLRFEYNLQGLQVAEFYQNPSLSKELVNTTGYDEWARVKRTQSGTFDPASSQYDLVTDCRNEYDDIGRLYKKGIGTTGNPASPFLEYLEFSHDIRNRLTRQQGDRFKYELTYDLRGNILVNRWQNQQFDSNSRFWNQYRYQYDYSDRLVAADYSTVTYSSGGASMQRISSGNSIDLVPTENEGREIYASAKDLTYTPKVPFADEIKRIPSIEPEVFAQSPKAMQGLVYRLGERALAQFQPSEILDEVSFLIAKPDLEGNLTDPSDIDLSSSAAQEEGQDIGQYAIIQPQEKYDAWYRYDGVGNLTNLKRILWDGSQVTTQELNYGYPTSGDNNQLQSVSGLVYNSSFTYDLNGNLLSDSEKGIQSIGYDWRNMPLSVDRGTQTSTFRYGPNGNRIMKRVTAGSAVTDEEYLIGNHVVLATGEVRSLKTGSGYATVDPQTETLERFYSLTDWLGSVRVVFDEAGTIHNATDYYPYGEPLGERHLVTDPESERLKFTGHQRDQDLADIDYHGARYYNPVIGRYLSVDPQQVDFPGLSAYVYTLDNPVMLVDPDGRWPRWFWPRWKKNAAKLAERADGILTEKENRWEVEFTDPRDGARTVAWFHSENDQDDLFTIYGPGYALSDHQSFGDRLFAWKIRNKETIDPISDGIEAFGKEVGAIVYEANPISLVTEAITGQEGPKSETLIGEGIGLATIFVNPTGGAARGVVNTVPRTKDVLGHIFRKAPGHVNPATAASQGRYIGLFEKVAANLKNLNTSILNPQAVENGVQAFTQTFRNGQQVWVHTRNGRIFDAGVNIIPK